MSHPLPRRLILAAALASLALVPPATASARCTDGPSCRVGSIASVEPGAKATGNQRRNAASKQRQRLRRCTRVTRKRARRSRRTCTPRTPSRHARDARTISAATLRRGDSLPRTQSPADTAPAGAPAAPPTSTSSPRALAGGLGSERLFAGSSIWNRPLADAAQLDPSSAARMRALNDEIAREKAAGTGPWINDTRYSTPIYRVSASQPRVPVTLDNGSWGNNLRRALAPGVPIPQDAKPAQGTDGHMVVYQASADTLWEFWRATKKADGWHAIWGGVIEDVSANPGYYDNTAVGGLGRYEGWNWGATATSLSVAGGVITIGDLRAGSIDHALAVGVPTACAKTLAWPAQRTDGRLTTADCLPEGARLRLDPSLDLDSMHLPSMTLLMARAAQKYGIVVRDVTWSVVSFVADDPTPTGTNPYVGTTGLYGGDAPWRFVSAFPWKHLQLTDMTLCTAAPCRPPAASARRRAGARR